MNVTWPWVWEDGYLKEHPEMKHPLIAFARTFFPKSRRRDVKGAAAGKGQREPHQRGWKEDKKEE